MTDWEKLAKIYRDALALIERRVRAINASPDQQQKSRQAAAVDTLSVVSLILDAVRGDPDKLDAKRAADLLGVIDAAMKAPA